MNGAVALLIIKKYCYSHQLNTYYFEERLVLAGNKEVISIVRDVTDQEEFESKLQYISYHDSLTSLYNRRFFENELSRLDVQRNLPISIVMGDVNGLKLLNDAFGHLAGDELLQRVAQVMKQACRDNDIVARWGGDEFVAILPNTSRNGAEEIIRRIEVLCAQTEVESVKLSISFGYETKENLGEDITTLLASAEAYMYKNKLRDKQGVAGRSVQSIYRHLS